VIILILLNIAGIELAPNFKWAEQNL